MAELLVKATDNTHPDPVIDRRGSYKKGDIVVAMPDGHPWGSAERPPGFIVVRCPELDLDVARARTKPWEMTLDWAVVGTDLSVDGARLRIFSETESPGGGAQVAREDVEDSLAEWNASVVSVAANEVRFDMTVYQAAISEGFWHRPTGDGSRFTEVSYDQSSGVHRISFDYAALLEAPEPDELARAVERRGGTVVSNADSLITFDIGRETLRAAFKADMKVLCQTTYQRRRYYFTTTQVDWVLANDADGVLDVTLAQLQTHVHDRMAE